MIQEVGKKIHEKEMDNRLFYDAHMTLSSAFLITHLLITAGGWG